jgi:transposase
MSLEGMGPSLTVEGATTVRVFEAYVKEVLAPSLPPGRVVVMDNLGAHRPKRIRELIEARVASFSTYRATLRTTTRSRRPSPRSRTSFARPQPGARRYW